MDDRASQLPSLFVPGSRRGLLVAAALCLVATAAVLPCDAWVAQWFAHERLPAAARKLLQLSEFFGHGLGILMIGLAIHQLDPPRRWAIPRVLLTALSAGVLADVVKLVVARLRPRDGGVNGVTDIVQGWFAVAGEGKATSFPSGHAAATVGLALALAALYPRGRWFFFGLAVLAMCQRLDEGAHFLSDLLAGAAIGCLTAALTLRVGPLAALFERRETQWRTAVSK